MSTPGKWGRLWLRQFYRKGTLTNEAWTAAESFMADIDALESRWSMDPTIVMLVVSQLLVATAIGYATAVEAASVQLEETPPQCAHSERHVNAGSSCSSPSTMRLCLCVSRLWKPRSQKCRLLMCHSFAR